MLECSLVVECSPQRCIAEWLQNKHWNLSGIGTRSPHSGREGRRWAEGERRIDMKRGSQWRDAGRANVEDEENDEDLVEKGTENSHRFFCI